MHWDPEVPALLELECIQVEQQATSNFLYDSLPLLSLGKWWWNLRTTQALVSKTTSRVSQYISIMNFNYSLAGQLTTINRNKNPSSKPQSYFAITSLSIHEGRNTLLLHYGCVLKSHELLAFWAAELEQNHVRRTLLTIKLRMEELWKFTNLPRHTVHKWCNAQRIKPPEVFSVLVHCRFI